MDFKGQRLAELFFSYILVLSGVLAFLTGYVIQSFQLMMAVFSSGVALSLLISVPDWPMYNRHGVKWLPPKHASSKSAPRGAPTRAQSTPSLGNFFRMFS